MVRAIERRSQNGSRFDAAQVFVVEISDSRQIADLSEILSFWGSVDDRSSRSGVQSMTDSFRRISLLSLTRVGTISATRLHRVGIIKTFDTQLQAWLYSGGQSGRERPRLQV